MPPISYSVLTSGLSELFLSASDELFPLDCNCLWHLRSRGVRGQQNRMGRSVGAKEQP